MSERSDAGRPRWLERILALMPAFVSWAVLVAPLILSVSYPPIIGYLILAAWLYWLCRAALLGAAALAGYRRVRRVRRVDWSHRLQVLVDRPARREALLRQLARLPAPSGATYGFSALASTEGARRALTEELAALDAIEAVPTLPAAPGAYAHVALIRTTGEPLETLRRTMQALAATDWPAERRYCAIIAPDDEQGGKANVEVLQRDFANAFADVILIPDPKEAGRAVEKGNAMMFGARALHRSLVRGRGIDSRRILVTVLDGDDRVEPHYFSHLTWLHLAEANRETSFYQPIQYLDNDLWEALLPSRLLAAMATLRQLRRATLPGRQHRTGSYAGTLQLILDTGYRSTDAALSDRRISWKARAAHGERFRLVHLDVPVHGDTARWRGWWRSLFGRYLQGWRWAAGPVDTPDAVRHAVRHPAPIRSRVGPLLTVLAEHAVWTVAPLALAFGVVIPLLVALASIGTPRSEGLLVAMAAASAAILAGLSILVYLEARIAPPWPERWRFVRRAGTALGWVLLPVVGLLVSPLPEIDVPARAGRTTPRSGRSRAGGHA